MALAIDASTPAFKTVFYGSTGNTPETTASNTFSPPAGSTIVVMSGANYAFTGSVGASSITDSSSGGPLTWTNIAKSILLTTEYGSSDAWWAPCPSSQTSMTVSVTHNAPSGQYLENCGIIPIVFTGAKSAATIGTVVSSNAASASTLAVSITPAAVGSALLIVSACCSSTTAATITATGTTFMTASGGTKGTIAMALIGTAALTPTLTPNTSAETFNLSASVNVAYKYAAFEVLAAAGAAAGEPDLITAPMRGSY